MTNIVIAVMDTARYDMIFEKGEIPPNIKQLSEDGTRYTNAFATAPWTLPSHTSIFSGQYPSKHGSNSSAKRYNPDAPSIIEVFNQSSYETVAVSNNTWISDEFNFGRGFDKFIKNWQFVQSNTDLSKIVREFEGIEKWTRFSQYLFNGNPLINLLNAVYAFRQHHQTDDDGAKRTNNWIQQWLSQRNDSSPFFLFINYLEPHLEYRPPKEHTEQFLPDEVTYKEAMEVKQDAFRYIAGELDLTEEDFDILKGLYQGEISYLDYRIGELISILRQAKEWEDTIFVLVGDHGENIGDHGLMDHQYCLYDTLIHVPLVIHGKEFNTGKINDDLIQLTDISPTLLDAAEVEAAEFRSQIQGSSFHPSNKKDEREYIFSEYISPQPSISALEKRIPKLSEDVYKYDRSLRTIRGNDWKLIRGSDGTKDLYNVTDGSEGEECSEDHPDRVRKLEQKLDEWLDSFSTENKDVSVDIEQSTVDQLEELGYFQ